MSFALYNKMKTIDSTRRDLKNILNAKGLNTTNVEALGSLVGLVGQLEKPNYETPQEEIWEGITRKPEPTDYYKGDDDWKDLIDLHAIMEADTENYPKKAIYLIRVSDNPEPDIVLSNQNYVYNQLVPEREIWGAYRCKFSDSSTVTSISTSTSHTWDTNKDIVASNGERFRYVIIYATASENAYIMYVPTHISFEAIYISDGQFYQVNPNGSSITSDNYAEYNYKCNISSPKYFEIGSNASISNCLYFTNQPSGGSYARNYYESRYKTIILNGNINNTSGFIMGEDLEFFKYNGTTKCPFNFKGLGNEQINTYIYIKATSNLSCTESANIDIYVDSINSIGDNKNNHNIKYSIYSDSNTSISTNAFSTSCLNVEVDLGNVGSVGNSAFYKFKDNKLKLGSINGNIGDLAFYDSCLHQDIVVLSGCTFIGSSSPTDGNYSCSAPFGLCDIEQLDLSQSSIQAIPNGVYRLDNPTQTSSSNVAYCYSGLLHESSIKSVILPDRLKYIYANAFAYSENLENVTFGSEILSISNGAFYNCANLKEVSLPDSITSLGNNIFYGCKNLTTVKLPNNLTSLPANIFSSCKSLVNIALPSRLSTLGNNSFRACESLQHITLPENVGSIPDRCFENCVNLLSIECPEGNIHTLGNYAFANCEKLEEIPNIHDVTTLNVGVFMNCKKLQIKCPSDATLMNIDCFAGNNDFIDFSEFNSANITTINLRGSLWTYENILKFLYKLPDRTGETKYTLKMGPSFSRMMWVNGSDEGTTVDYVIQTNTSFVQYEQSVYSNYANKYIKETSSGLEWSDSATTGAVTIADYVASKNWTLT